MEGGEWPTGNRTETNENLSQDWGVGVEYSG